jgi:peptide-methionine (S)-S-oxide reductase
VSTERTQVATLAGGCFWCLEAVFERLKGVSAVASGYIGGHVVDPSYEQVCTGTTGHAEAVRVAFDPGVITYRDLLEVFFAVHDPTTLNRQGPDTGPQYRSAIFHHDDAQRAEAEEAIRALDAQGLWGAPIVTEVVAAPEFYTAEGYHQEYYRRNGSQPYCVYVIDPKVAKLRKEFGAKLRDASHV